MKIYYITDQLGYWANPLHSYRKNWFTKKEEADDRKYTFEHYYIFNNTKYTVHSIDIPIDTKEYEVEYYSSAISKAILENTTSNIKAKELMLTSGIEYADIDKIIYYYNRRSKYIEPDGILNDLRPVVTADKLKKFIVDFIQPYEQAYFNNMIDDFFGTK